MSKCRTTLSVVHPVFQRVALHIIVCSRARVSAGLDAGGMLSDDVLLQEFGGGEHFATGQARLQAAPVF